MSHNEKISIHQFTILVFLFTTGQAILLAPSTITQSAKQDAWIAVLLGIITGSLFILFFTIIGKRYPNKSLVEYNEKILGKWAGKLVSFLYIFYFFFLSAILLREISYFITMQIMPKTPITAIHIIFICLVVYAARLGLEVVARTAEIFLPWVLLLLLASIVFLIPEAKIENIQPTFEGGARPILQGSIVISTLTFLQLSVLLMLFPNVQSLKKIRASFLTGASIGGIAIFFIVLMSILVLGPDMTTRQVYTSYILMKKINIADFLTRIEAMMAGLWLITIFFKLTLCFYASSSGLAQLLNIREYRILTFPLAIILVVFAAELYPDIAYFETVISTVNLTYSVICGLFFPLLLLIVDTIRRK